MTSLVNLFSHKTTPVLLTGFLFVVLAAFVTSSPPVATASPDRTAFAPVASDSLLERAKARLHDATNKGSTDSLRQARALFKRAANSSDHQALAHYYAALAGYRLSNLFPSDAEDKKEPVLNDAIDHLQTATDLDSSMADAWALLSGCYGQMTGMHPMQSMSLGPKSDDAMEKAKELAPENPRIWIIDGV
jgi:hypothetical protein